MTNLTQQFNSLKSSFDMKQGQLQAFRSRLETCQGQIVDLERKENISQKASLFLQSLSDITRLQVLDKISGIVTDALQTVKDKNLEFRMELCTKNNQPTLEMGILDKQSGQVYDILESMGGGIGDIVSIVLRTVLLCRWQPAISRVLVLDEAGKMISNKDQEVFAEFMKKLSEKLGIQIIWISHSNTLTSQAHRVFEVTKQNGISQVEEKTNI